MANRNEPPRPGKRVMGVELPPLRQPVSRTTPLDSTPPEPVIFRAQERQRAELALGAPITEPPRSITPVSNPPPASVPTSAAEREAAMLRAQLQELRTELKQARKPDAELDVVAIPGGAKLARWAIPIVVSVVSGGGGSFVKQAVSPEIPPAVAECPAKLEQLRGEIRIYREAIDEKVSRATGNADEARAKAIRLETRVESHEGQFVEIRQRLPAISGLPQK